MSDGTFFAYIALLFVSGAILAVLGLGGFGQSKGARILDGVFAAAFVVYAGYLLFVFDGGTVIISYYAFIVPILAIVQVFRARKAQREAAAAEAVPAAQAPPAGQA
ncbi:hypothetical protein AB0M54_13895 [Actinoplanes sp. NPDC051470]|uniref:hypothetical protein n=1 Tax=unclassified Actinoplanes TaxID=2626549 RepID=UPI0034365D93